MSLLDRGNATVEVFPEEQVVSRDGNVFTRASKEPLTIEVWLAPVGQSGTSARRAEQDLEGFETEKVMRMRMLRKNHHIVLGAQSKVRFEGQMWSVFGDVSRYMATPRTRHHDYTLRRA